MALPIPGSSLSFMLQSARKFYIKNIALIFIPVFILGSFFTFSVFAEESAQTPPLEPEVVVVEVPAPEPVIVPTEVIEVVENTNLLIEKDVTLESHCEVADTDGVTHVFPKADSLTKYLGICVLAEALKAGHINDFKLTNDPNLGLYVKSINGIEPSSTEFWGLWKNGAFADCGIGCLSIIEGDTMSLILTDWMAETESSKISLHVTALVPIVEEGEEDAQEEEQKEEQVEEEAPVLDGNGGGGGGGSSSEESESATPPTTFNIESALNYLKSVQSSDGSFGNSDLYTDWAAIAFSAGGAANSSLLEYYKSHNNPSSLLTDNERRAMALLSLGQDPYSFNGVNFIEAITDAFDGIQFGDTDLVNDDIFALIPLKNSGFSQSDDIISKTVAFIISKQNSDGSWFSSVDTTAAAIQALQSFKSVDSAEESSAKATDYLISKQNSDGGWENSIPSTSWAMQAESALGVSWEKNGKRGLHFLAAQQTSAGNDGAVLPTTETLENRIWATSYAIAGASGKSWEEIMESVSKPETQNADPDNSTADNSTAGSKEEEKQDTKITVETIVCPIGDLFSATTGKACTEFTPRDPVVILSVIDTPRMVVSVSKVKEKEVLLELVKEKDAVAETPPSLAAAAIEAVPDASQNIPIALSSFASVILLYAGFKAFKVY